MDMQTLEHMHERVSRARWLISQIKYREDDIKCIANGKYSLNAKHIVEHIVVSPSDKNNLLKQKLQTALIDCIQAHIDELKAELDAL